MAANENAPDVIEKERTEAFRQRRRRVRPTTPENRKVYLLNDDTTPFEFVIAILQDIFEKDFEEAAKLTAHIHNHGEGVAGIYPDEIATMKARAVRERAQQNDFELRAETRS